MAIGKSYLIHFNSFLPFSSFSHFSPIQKPGHIHHPQGYKIQVYESDEPRGRKYNNNKDPSAAEDVAMAPAPAFNPLYFGATTPDMSWMGTTQMGMTYPMNMGMGMGGMANMGMMGMGGMGAEEAAYWGYGGGGGGGMSAFFHSGLGKVFLFLATSSHRFRHPYSFITQNG